MYSLFYAAELSGSDLRILFYVWFLNPSNSTPLNCGLSIISFCFAIKLFSKNAFYISTVFGSTNCTTPFSLKISGVLVLRCCSTSLRWARWRPSNTLDSNSRSLIVKPLRCKGTTFFWNMQILERFFEENGIFTKSGRSGSWCPPFRWYVR